MKQSVSEKPPSITYPVEISSEPVTQFKKFNTHATYPNSDKKINLFHINTEVLAFIIKAMKNKSNLDGITVEESISLLGCTSYIILS